MVPHLCWSLKLDVYDLDSFSRLGSNGHEGTMTIKHRQLIGSYGTRWARNKENIQALRMRGRLWGVYVLCDGSMPVYIGRGKLSARIAGHMRGKTRSQFWDHFSWYAIPDRRFEADVEALLLRMLPFYLRSLNKQRTRFTGAQRVTQESRVADPIKPPGLGPKRKRK